MKILVFGGSGMLGHKLVQTLSSRFELFSTIRNTNKFYQTNIIKKGKIIEHINVENIFEVESLINEIKPAVIINAVGIIKQLPSSKNVITTLRINSIFPHQLAEISAKVGARLINMSTDCVFSGKRENTSNQISLMLWIYTVKVNIWARLLVKTV